MKCALLIFCLLANVAYSQIDVFRNAFFTAADPAGIKNFYAVTSKSSPANAVELAYAGVATAMQAEVAEGISDKLSYFENGKKLLEEAVRKDWYNPEIRFLRFSVQSRIPFFLGYNSNQDDDVAVIINGFQSGAASISGDFWKRAVNWMKEYGDLSGEQLQKLPRV